jgi:hypothetical protein
MMALNDRLLRSRGQILRWIVLREGLLGLRPRQLKQTRLAVVSEETLWAACVRCDLENGGRLEQSGGSWRALNIGSQRHGEFQ